MKLFLLSFTFFIGFLPSSAQLSVAREWNDANIFAITMDSPRPPVQARNLYHVSMAMYEAWALYHPNHSQVILGRTVNSIFYPKPDPAPLISSDTEISVRMAISFAAYRILQKRYAQAIGINLINQRLDDLMFEYGYDTSIRSTDYGLYGPAAVGNYIAESVLQFGLTDNSSEAANYANSYYSPSNAYLNVVQSGANTFTDINQWQPLFIIGALDQNNNPIQPNQVAICPEWGNVTPFALDPNLSSLHSRQGNDYRVYFDPGGPSRIDTTHGFDSSSMHYKWAYTMVALWSALLDPNDTTLINISPSNLGNLSIYPTSLNDQMNYYNSLEGGDTSKGYNLNPVSGTGYADNWVKRGDYTRVVSQYWADGPNSETPPGHWFNILNQVSYNPIFQRKLEGFGPTLSALEWDIKAYLTLGGALHDAAIAAWALKGYYDSPRPISVIRKMAQYGQSSDSTLPHYHPAGFPLIPGKVELVYPGDSLAAINPANTYKIKIKAWRGFDFISNSMTDAAGVGWILAENWWPYQRRFFITPAFPGYVSGHSTFSRAGAEILTKLTGSPYFPGGLYTSTITTNSHFLVFEHGPTQDIQLQYASYYDASNEASLSRMYGGIHPPTDDGHGRWIGTQVANTSFQKALMLFNGTPLPSDEVTLQLDQKNCMGRLNITLENPQAWSALAVYTTDGSQDELLTQFPVEEIKSSYTVTQIPLTQHTRITVRGIGRNQEVQVLGSKELFADGCEENLFTLRVFPNPSNDRITLSGSTNPGDLFHRIQIRDLFGKLILEKTLDAVSLLHEEVDVRSLSNGFYIAEVLHENGRSEVVRFSVVK
jgi:hypothetical protein